MAFMITTLIDYGWSAGGAAMAITIMSAVGMFVQPVYGFICDKLQSEKKLTITLLIIAIVFFALFPFSLRSGNMILIFLNMTGIAVTGVQVNGLLDAWIVGLKQEIPSVNYGLIRGCGSFAYALSAQLMGTITVLYGHDARIWIGGAATALTAIAAITFRSAKRTHIKGALETEEKQNKNLKGAEALKLVFSSKPYCLLLAVSFFLFLSSMAITTMIQLLARDFGGSTAHIGTATAVMAVSEVPIMFLMAVLIRKFGYKKLLILCSAAYVVRMIMTASVVSVNGLIYVQLFQAITYAVLLPLSMSYLSIIVDERVRSTAVTIYCAITAALTNILSNLITSAFLSAGYSAGSVIIIFVIFAIIGLLLTLYGLFRKIWDIRT
ncbi:MAG: MFS transporter [Treponema sp.]|nr:MFS transporter [Treponema sp.]